MCPDALSIDTHEDRYTRLGLIPWWDQARLKNAKIVVIGAGALGNEIIKNLALLGLGNILIVDFDVIEMSNLSRSVLYRSTDDSSSKAHTAAGAAREINPDCSIHALNADITSEVGLGIFRWADVVICGLDNREARLAVNMACWKVNTPWVDGATESLQGVARVFTPPDGVCYECTLSEADQRLMSIRNSCGFIAKEAIRQGHTPTTPTTSAVIAGIEVQEAIKLLHPDAKLPNLIGKGFFFDGISYDCFTIAYTKRDDCISHETFSNIIETDFTSDSATLGDVLHEAAKHIGDGAIIDLPSEMVTELHCSECDSTQPYHRLLRSISPDEALCPTCGTMRVPEVATECDLQSSFVNITLADLGFGVMDIIAARAGDQEIQIEISADKSRVFEAQQ